MGGGGGICDNRESRYYLYFFRAIRYEIKFYKTQQWMVLNFDGNGNGDIWKMSGSFFEKFSY